MSIRAGILAITVSLGLAAPALAAEFAGPGRFCGYSPIIDMKEGEKIVPTSGGVHGGGFIWSGEFGRLDVYATGWASKPDGREIGDRTAKGHVRFRQKREDGQYVVAIWNGEHGAAYFSSKERLSKAQIAAIERVDLYNEGEEQKDCKYRTVFVLD